MTQETATIIAAGISAFGTIIAVLVGRIPIESFFSRRNRKRHDIPEVMGTKWRANWYFEDGSVYIADDRVTLEKWTKDNRFEGYGEVTIHERDFKYPIEGEVSPTHLIVLTYKGEGYPKEAANIGTATLQLQNGFRRIEGMWSGRASRVIDGTEIPAIRSGKVTMERVR